MRIRSAPLLLGIAVSAGGCAGTVVDPAHHPQRPAAISHIVFIKLKDPAAAPALIAECDARLATIWSVSSYACGPHLEMGRPTVIHDYDVGMCIGFQTNEAYLAYVQHPSHQQLVKDWAPRAEWMHVYDVVDETP